MRAALTDAAERGLTLENDPAALRSYVAWLCAMAAVFRAEPHSHPLREWLPAYIRADPIGETLAEADSAEQELADLEREQAAHELLAYAHAQPELAGWTITAAREWIERCGDAARSTR